MAEVEMTFAQFQSALLEAFQDGVKAQRKAYHRDVSTRNKDLSAERRAFVAAGGAIPDNVHGKHIGYKSWGCRCDLCKSFMAEYFRSWHQKSKGD